jgi:CSLREA domain-containing protein
MSADTQRRNLLRVGAGAVVGLLGSALPLTGALAVDASSVISVTTTADEITANGACSLREAVLAANTDSAVDSCPAGSGADTIVVPAGTFTLSIAGSFEDRARTGDLDLTADVTIAGSGSIIDANGIDRVIEVFEGSTVALSGLTIRGGHVVLAEDPTDLAPNFYGGGVLNVGTLTVQSSVVTANATDVGVNGPGSGGGIANEGVLTVLDSSVTDNTAADNATGGGIFSSGVMTVKRSTISGNRARAGGGLDNSGQAQLVDTTVSFNSTVECNNCLEPIGGGILNVVGISITNSTITGNSTAAGPPSEVSAGGGLGNVGHVTLNSVTVSNNNASGRCIVDSCATGTGGGIWSEGFSVGVSNTIISGNTVTSVAAPEDGGLSTTGPSDCVGPVTSLGYNLVGDSSGCGFVASATDIVGANPLLGVLQGNGGPTMTQDLGVGSAAIDAGSPAAVGSGDTACRRADQRGMPRSDDGNVDGTARCDIGAVETTAIDSTSYAVRYDGWTGRIDAAASGGGYRAASAAGQTVSLTKTRANTTSSVSIITYKGPDQGKVAVTIDGGAAVTKDLYAATPAFLTVISFTVPSANKHTISIKVLGTRNAASTGTEFRFDGAKFAGTVFDDTNLSARYGGWSSTANTSALSRSYRSTSVVATASFDTIGPVFTLITARGPAYGMVRVTIDGVTRANLDLYRPSQTWLARQTFTNLGSGVHHVVIKALGTKNVSSTGAAVVFDAVTLR